MLKPDLFLAIGRHPSGVHVDQSSDLSSLDPNAGSTAENVQIMTWKIAVSINLVTRSLRVSISSRRTGQVIQVLMSEHRVPLSGLP